MVGYILMLCIRIAMGIKDTGYSVTWSRSSRLNIIYWILRVQESIFRREKNPAHGRKFKEKERKKGRKKKKRKKKKRGNIIISLY